MTSRRSGRRAGRPPLAGATLGVPIVPEGALGLDEEGGQKEECEVATAAKGECTGSKERPTITVMMAKPAKATARPTLKNATRAVSPCRNPGKPENRKTGHYARTPCSSQAGSRIRRSAYCDANVRRRGYRTRGGACQRPMTSEHHRDRAQKAGEADRDGGDQPKCIGRRVGLLAPGSALEEGGRKRRRG